MERESYWKSFLFLLLKMGGGGGVSLLGYGLRGEESCNSLSRFVSFKFPRPFFLLGQLCLK